MIKLLYSDFDYLKKVINYNKEKLANGKTIVNSFFYLISYK